MIIDHSSGQLRAELFEEVVGLLIPRVLGQGVYVRDFIVPSVPNDLGIPAFTADFGLIQDGMITLVEAKAPYNERAQSGLERTFRRLKRAVKSLPKTSHIKTIILAVAAELSPATSSLLEVNLGFFVSRHISVEIWDAPKLSALFRDVFKQKLETFSVEELRQLLYIQGRSTKKKDLAELSAAGQRPAPATARSKPQPQSVLGQEYVVLSSDLCSYSSFVRASNTDYHLAVVIMSRFYRDTRQIVELHGGKLDKFIGDGVLVWWEYKANNKNLSEQIADCARQLVGMALRITKEWQDQIDLAISPQGMRVGAAIGRLLMIPESDSPNAPIHAVGEVINKAARLSKLNPNTFCVTNQLKRLLFADDDGFEERQPLELKNLGGQIMYWEKDLTSSED